MMVYSHLASGPQEVLGRVQSHETILFAYNSHFLRNASMLVVEQKELHRSINRIQLIIAADIFAWHLHIIVYIS